MRIPHNGLVLVADGRKVLFLRNHGDEKRIDLRIEAHEEREDHKDRELKSDAPGLTQQRFGHGRPAVDEADFHDQAEERWAARIAAAMNERVLAGGVDDLVVLAPPRTLGILRAHWHKEVEARLIGEMASEMTDRPIPDIEALIVGDAAPPAGP